jgi:prephenate dehydratase
MAAMSEAADAAYQGTRGAFSEQAALALCGSGAQLMPCRDLEDVFRAIAEGRAKCGVVPDWNSTAGPVPGCSEFISGYATDVEGEILLPVIHALIVVPGASLVDVREVTSHPMALAQCEEFLRRHPNLRPVPAYDTAGAVADVIRRGDKSVAAIGSRRAADAWGGAVLLDQIQDSADNVTRFLLVRARRNGHLQ